MTSGVMNPDKLAKLQEQARTGGAAALRRKLKKPAKPAVAQDDRKLSTCLSKLRATPIPAIQEVNMFDEDGKVIHFQAPRVMGAVPANTFVVQGPGEERDLTEMLPGILGQLGGESLDALRRMAQAMQAQSKQDDGVPELVEEFAEQQVDA